MTRFSAPQNSQARLSPKQIVKRVLSSGRITTADRNGFLHATLADIPLAPDELDQIRQVLDRLQMGLIKVVD